MSILIKGMEMPKTCDDCFLPLRYCPYAMKPNGECPLVPVPTPHGRLGDLDEINEKHDKLSRDFCHGYFKSTWDFVCAARKIFYDAPTIIPAEEGE